MRISPLASIFIAREESIMSQEMMLLVALQGAERYEVDQGQLTIFHKTEQEICGRSSIVCLHNCQNAECTGYDGS
ncbi:hypothetical protein IQ250_08060 [Pseudanabaenaceae cyanobacterium LEGE 13415]|nr:hypothetical protein [Pseudanabaenaceae cyanobacterium LEGE 13415]